MSSEGTTRLAVGVLGMLLLLPFGEGAARAQDATSDAGAARATAANEPQGWAYALANQLMSPFCPGRTLADCPSPQAESLRMWIVVQEAAGRSRESVLEELYARYGDEVRARPRAEGFGLTAYLAPLAVFLGGGGLVAWWLRRWTRRGERETGQTPPVPEGELDRWLEGERPR